MATYFATKYDNPADEIIAILSDIGEGYGSDSTGDTDSPMGYSAIVHLDNSCDLDFTDTSTNYPVGDEVGEIARAYGVNDTDVIGSHIVTTNSQGFVSVDTFTDKDSAINAFNCLAGHYAAWSDEDRDNDSDGVYVCPVIGHGYHTV